MSQKSEKNKYNASTFTDDDSIIWKYKEKRNHEQNQQHSPKNI